MQTEIAPIGYTRHRKVRLILEFHRRRRRRGRFPLYRSDRMEQHIDVLFVSRRHYQTFYDRIDPSRFCRPHGVCATVIGGEDENPGCIRFRFDDRSAALLGKKHGGAGDRLSGGVPNRAFESDRMVRGRILLESCRARQSQQRGNQYGQSPASPIPCPSRRAPQFVPAVYHSRPNSFVSAPTHACFWSFDIFLLATVTKDVSWPPTRPRAPT